MQEGGLPVDLLPDGLDGRDGHHRHEVLTNPLDARQFQPAVRRLHAQRHLSRCDMHAACMRTVYYVQYSCLYAPATCEHRLSAMGRWPRAALRGQVPEPERLHLLRHALLAELHHLVEPSQQLAASVLRALYANVLVLPHVHLTSRVLYCTSRSIRFACMFTPHVCAPGLLSNDQSTMWPLAVLIWNDPTNNGMASLSCALRSIRVRNAKLVLSACRRHLVDDPRVHASLLPRGQLRVH